MYQVQRARCQNPLSLDPLSVDHPLEYIIMVALVAIQMLFHQLSFYLGPFLIIIIFYPIIAIRNALNK